MVGWDGTGILIDRLMPVLSSHCHAHLVQKICRLQIVIYENENEEIIKTSAFSTFGRLGKILMTLLKSTKSTI